MLVDQIDSIEALDRVCQNWDVVFKADPEASIYLSFPWLRPYVAVANYPPLILAMRPVHQEPYVAFLPLTINRVRHMGVVQRELRMLGFPFADYTGMLCLPGYEEKAVTVFAEFVKQRVAWDIFVADNVRDKRCVQLMATFAHGKFCIESTGKSACPYIELPTDWGQYFMGQLDPDFRRNIKRRLRQVESQPNVRLVDVCPENLESQIETMIALNEARFGARGRKKIFAAIYRGCFNANCLYLRTVWDGDVPIAANSGFIDRVRQTFFLYSSGFNPAYSQISPGTSLTALTIRFAIENGFRVFDFGRGAQRYKYSFGATDRSSRHWTVRRRGLRGTLTRAAHRTASAARRFSASLKRGGPKHEVHDASHPE